MLVHAQEFGDDKHLVHSGMLASALWLNDRLYCVAQVQSHDHCMPILSWACELGVLSSHTAGQSLRRAMPDTRCLQIFYIQQWCCVSFAGARDGR